ncbi:MAG: hypothetical protein J6S85_19520 [Methanobrevibacter sp.]|nr:hypothetical protein [Methanobrevibacter sp.]
MKKETKELIDWIVHIINIQETNAKKEKAIKFLTEDLPKIESRLCRGGYIQDKNEIPCCEGDTITFKRICDDKVITGKLCWFTSDCRFYCKDEEGFKPVDTDFEKVSNQEI